MWVGTISFITVGFDQLNRKLKDFENLPMTAGLIVCQVFGGSLMEPLI